jgi:hypothetical protein
MFAKVRAEKIKPKNNIIKNVELNLMTNLLSRENEAIFFYASHKKNGINFLS